MSSSKTSESSALVLRSPAGRFQRGGASPNPRGRPRSGTSFAEAVRREVAPEDIIRCAAEIMEHAEEDRDRLKAAEFLASRGWGAPVSVVQLEGTLAGPAGLPPHWDSLDAAGRKAFLARFRAGAALALAAAPDAAGDGEEGDS